MKTTIDLPPEILHRAKVVAAQRRTTLKELVIAGLDQVLTGDYRDSGQGSALARLRQGMHLGNRPLSREEIHARS